MEKCLKIGPWGGKVGDARGFTADDQTGITSIKVFLGGVIDSITFKWGDEQNPQRNSYKIGGEGGHFDGKEILLDWPREYLTSISGTFASYEGHDVIYSLRFETNKQRHEPHGTLKGTPFELFIENGKIVGFHGRQSQYVNAIGVYAGII